MNVKVIDEHTMPAASEPDFIRVRVTRTRAEEPTTLATIERVVRKSTVKAPAPRRRVKKLVERQPMTLADAVGFAKLYAASKHIGLVLTAREV